MTSRMETLVIWVVSIALMALVCVGGFAGCGAAKNWQRGQKRADARNAVKVTHIKIQQAQQQAKIIHAQNAAIKAKAEQRVIEAEGIRKAQDKIQATLTPLYVQHEAIQAQERIAESGKNNTLIYVPAGTSGVPLVNDVGHPGTPIGASQSDG